MAIHTTTGSTTTMVDGYIYLTDATVDEIGAAAPEIPSGKTVVPIQASGPLDFQHTNQMVNLAMPRTKWTTQDTKNWLINLKRITQTLEVRGTIESDSTDTVQQKKLNIRFLIGSLLPYETGFTSGDRRGGTFTICRMRTIPISGGTSDVREKFRVGCRKASLKEIPSNLHKFEVMLQLIEGQDKLQG